MLKRSNAVIAMTPAVDMTDKEGFFIKADGNLAGAGETPFGVITEVLPNGGDVSVAVCSGQHGTLTIKLGADGVRGDLVGSDANGATDPAAAVVAAQLLEDGSAGELCEATVFIPQG